mgnify:CR=1 FL=1
MQLPRTFCYTITMLQAFVTLLVMSVGAPTSRCAVIKDHDARMTCFAVATKNSSYCAFVKDHDARARCYVSLEVK